MIIVFVGIVKFDLQGQLLRGQFTDRRQQLVGRHDHIMARDHSATCAKAFLLRVKNIQDRALALMLLLNDAVQAWTLAATRRLLKSTAFCAAWKKAQASLST